MNSHLRASLAASSLAFLAACASTDPLEGASINYRMPRTDAVAKIIVTMNVCDKDNYDVSAEIEISPKPGVDDTKWYRVKGYDLASHRIKRAMQVNVNDDGVISAVNTTNTDQTTAIIESVAKIAGPLFGIMFKGDGVPRSARKPCDTEFPGAAAAVKRAKGVQDAIEAAKEKIAALPPENLDDRVKLTKRLNYLATELVAIRQGLLKVQAELPIKLDKPNTGWNTVKIEPDAGPFEKWFDPNVSATDRKTRVAEHFLVAWSAEEITLQTLDENKAKPNPPPVQFVYDLAQPDSSAASRPGSCELKMSVPRTTQLKLTVSGEGASLQNPKPVDTKIVPLAQVGTPALICLDVGYGESRTVGLKFDKFGRTTEFNWASEATGAVIAGSLAGTAETASGIYTTLRGPSELDKLKKQVEELETQQKLNALLACKAIIDAGGFKCEKEGEDE